jgi:Rod binding domain-containing protein
MLADHIAQHRGIGIADALITQLKEAAKAYEALEKPDGAQNENAPEGHGSENITNAGEAKESSH